MLVKVLHKDYQYGLHMLGMLPYWLHEGIKDSAAQQLNKHYQHGGGWRPFHGFTFYKDSHAIEYPGDPEHKPVAEIHFRDERIYVYDHAWVAIVQPDGTYEICRMD